MLHYLPGCDVKKNHPEAINKLINYLQDKGAVIDKCCRNKESFLIEGDTIINNCTLCNIVLNEVYPNSECLSLYEYVLQDDNFPWVSHSGETITIQDCWRTRDNKNLHKAIRKCLIKMDYTIIELEDNYDKTKFCGVWLNNPPAKDCIEIAPNTFKDIIDNYLELLSTDQQKSKMEEWVKHYPTDYILVYCNGCERGIKLGGKQPIHIVELLAQGLK